MTPARPGSCHHGATSATRSLALAAPAHAQVTQQTRMKASPGRGGQENPQEQRGSQAASGRPDAVGAGPAVILYNGASLRLESNCESSRSLCVQRTQNIFTFSFCQLNLSWLQTAAQPRAVTRLRRGSEAAPDGVRGSGWGAGLQAPGLPAPASTLGPTAGAAGPRGTGPHPGALEDTRSATRGQEGWWHPVSRFQSSPLTWQLDKRSATDAGGSTWPPHSPREARPREHLRTAGRGRHSLVLVPEDSPHHADGQAEQRQEQHADPRAFVEVGQAVVGDPGGRGGGSRQGQLAPCHHPAPRGSSHPVPQTPGAPPPCFAPSSTPHSLLTSLFTPHGISRTEGPKGRAEHSRGGHLWGADLSQSPAHGSPRPCLLQAPDL